MKLTHLPLPGLILIEPVEHRDARGFFLESFHAERYREAGLEVDFVQDNHSHSRKGVLRGLHYQAGQKKLVSVIHGEIFDVAVDVRPESPAFGQWYGALLSDANHHQLFVPSGFAHGFCILSPHADVLYKTSDYWRPEREGGIIWNDPAIGIDWPMPDPILSDRDRRHPRLAEIPRERLGG